MAKRKPAATPSRTPDPTNPEVRVRIEQTAYYLAERRGFSPGYELEDWLQAEKQVLVGQKEGP